MSAEVEAASFELSESSLDVRELQALHKQLSVVTKLADSEEYILPMYVGDELAKVHLTLEHSTVQKGEVSIRINLSQEIQVEAHFQLHNKSLSGFLVGNKEAEVTKLQKAADIFLELVQESDYGWQMEKLPIVSGYVATTSAAVSGKGLEQLSTDDSVQQASNTELYQVAKLFLQAIK